jgi:uncharacterized protein (DUF2235 family)
MGGGGKGLTASDAQSGRRGERRRGGFTARVTAGTVEKTGLTSEAHASAMDREKASRTEGMNQRRKRTSANTPMARVGRAA